MYERVLLRVGVLLIGMALELVVVPVLVTSELMYERVFREIVNWLDNVTELVL